MDEAIHITWQWAKLLGGIAVVAMCAAFIVAIVSSSFTSGVKKKDDGEGVGVMCQMCGQWFPSPSDTFDTVPDHRRPDILAMIDRGDFDNG